MDTVIEPGFDMDKAKRNINAYSCSTGIGASIIDSKGNLLYEAPGGNLCRYCLKKSSREDGRPPCSSVHLYGTYQAERFGGKYVYFCPVGLVHWASPLTSGGTVLGALIGGPVSMVDLDDLMIDNVLDRKLREQLSNTEVVPPNVVNSLSELLFLVASSITEDSISKHELQRQYHEIQAQISDSVQDLKAFEEVGGKQAEYPFEKEKELLNWIALGDKPAAQRILNEILGYVFFSSGKDFEVIKARTLELVVLLSRAAVEGGADTSEIFGLNFRYLSDIHKLKTVEDLTYWLSGIMARFTDCVFNLADVRHKDTIFKAVDYIKRNYMKRITLEEVASYVYLNPSYFSRIFKDEMGCNFVAYINKIRINASKSLLSDASIPLTEVSDLAGFEDQSYFTKVFKKATGVTPGKYREYRGQMQ